MQLPQFQVHARIEQAHWWFLARRSIMRAVMRRVLPPARDKLVIDVGCGTGGNTAAVARDYRCIGIDPIPEAIAFARERFPGLDFRCGYAPQDLPDDFGRADFILLMDVLEHVEDDRAIVQSLIAAMKPGAFLLMMAPADPSLSGQHDKGFEHYRRYTSETFRRTWAGAKIEEVMVSHSNARLYPAIKLARAVSRVLGRSFGPANTDLGLPPKPVNALLRTIFAGEARRLLGVIDERARPYRRGVSVLALLRRTGS